MYPELQINLSVLEHNAAEIVNRCHAAGIRLAGVVKGFNAIPEAAMAYKRAGADQLASSRISQIKKLSDAGVPGPYMLLRIPMMSELPLVAEYADYSVHSEISVLRAFNEECRRQGVKRKVVVMADLGDIREGFWDKEEMADVCCEVENSMDCLELAGVGVNLGCYGSVSPTEDKMNELIAVADEVEKRIGRKLEMVSGGATSSYTLLLAEEMPAGITHLRIGEGATIEYRMEEWDVQKQFDDILPGTYTLRLELLEIKTKPSHPRGRLGIDAFGHKPVYEDRGFRKRALMGLGRADAGDVSKLVPLENGVEVVGASSDHLILDVTEYEGELKPGDVLSFAIKYENQLYLTNSDDVHITFA